MIPYLISDTYVGLGSKVGFIFGSMAALSVVFTYWLVPECKGKSLEQVDQLFNAGVNPRNFGRTDAPPMMQADARSIDEKQSVLAVPRVVEEEDA